MIEVKKDQMSSIAHFFEGIQDSMVIACLQGYMGNAYLRSWEEPRAALIVSGEYSFFGGDPASEDGKYLSEHLFDVAQNDTSVAIFADDRPEWKTTLMHCDKNHPQVVSRFGIVQKDYDFDMDLLQSCIDALPEGYEMKRFDETMYRQALSEDWSMEFCETFSSAEDFLSRGFGFGVMADGHLVSGASTMTVYDGGTEIQVATREDFRQKGLALPCAAALVKECTRRGIRPCWDAANLISKKMALKLGYEYKGEYTTIHMKK